MFHTFYIHIGFSNFYIENLVLKKFLISIYIYKSFFRFKNFRNCFFRALEKVVDTDNYINK